MKSLVKEHSPQARAQLRQFVANARYEIIPLESTADNVTLHVPKDVRLTITASPARGQDATIALAETLAGHGYVVAPHLSARLVRDHRHLTEIVTRCRSAGITACFVIGGDPTETSSEFADAYALLSALHGLDHSFTSIGIGGHPEGQPSVEDSVLIEALECKAPLAHYITTQICFDPTTIVAWSDQLERHGIDLPIHVGVPGAVRRKKLIRISGRLGIGESARFLKKQHDLFLRFFRPGGYSPDHILNGIASHLNITGSNIGGIHIFTFNDLEATEAWRQRTLRKLARTP